ncbi:MAG: CusA/CzcA family heavy metal efflux RND transporter [Gemmatimonadales bacterium]
MIQRLLEWSLRNRFLVLILTALLIGGGAWALKGLPIDAVPDVTNVQVQVLTTAPALGPEEVERFVTTPVELAMSGLPGLSEMRSISRFGLSAVTVVFKDGTDVYFARQLVNERVQAAREEIPPGYGSPEMGPVTTGLGEIYQFVVRGDGKTPMELRTILEWNVAPRLRQVPGVIEVNAFGGQLRTYEVAVRPERLAAYGVSLSQLFEALERNNANAGGAYIEKNSEQYLIRGEGLVGTLQDLEDVVVTNDPKDGTPVYVRQIADLRFAPMVRQGAVTRDGDGEVVTGIVLMLLGANSRQVVSQVKATVADMNPTLAKLGVRVEPFYDRTDLVKKTIKTVAKNLAEGALLVIVVLFLVLRNLRAGLLTASVIPLSMLAAFIGMRAAGVSGNLMSLGALDFGLIVDGAVIVVENVVRMIAERSHRLGRALTPDERTGAVLEGCREVLGSTVFGVTIISIVYLPILSLSGVEGKMFGPMALTVLFALLGSLILAVTLIPVLASLFLPGKLEEKEPGFLVWTRRRYRPALEWSMARPRTVLGIGGGLFLVALLIAPFLGAEFVPRLDEGALAVQAWRLPSISLEESVRQTGDIERTLKRFPEVVTVVSKTGRAEIATDPMGVEVSDILVMLKPHGEWSTAGTREELIAAMDSVLRVQVPGTVFSYSQPIELRVSELISGVRSDVALKIYGEDLATLERTAAAAVRVLSQVPGAADVKAEQTAGLPVLRIRLDRRAMARYGINAADALDVITTLGGREAGVVLEGQRRFAVQVRFDESARRDPAQIGTLPVRSPAGQLIPLSQIAQIGVEDGPAQISHESGRRRITVELNVRGRDLAGFVADAQRAVAAADVLPAGYFAEWGGQFQNLREATARLTIVVPLALALIFVLLFLSQGSASLAGIIFLNVPFAISGGIIALAIRGLPLSISAGVGFIALFGVAVLTGLVLLGYAEQRRREGASVLTAAREATEVRLRPVLMAGLVAALGYVPMAIASGSGAEVQRPLATVVIGGLITSTLLTLLVLPAVYAWIEGRTERRASASTSKEQAV